MQICLFAFLRPPLGNLGATYDDHLRLIGKRVVDFLLALIELISLGVTAEELRAIIGWKSAISFQRGSVDPKFQVEGVAPDQPFFFSENWDKCSFVWYINLDRSFYRFVTVHACDGQTDRILIARPRLHCMQRGKNWFESVSVSVCGHSRHRISWSIITKICTDVRTPKSKYEFIGGQYHTTPSPILPLKIPILGQEFLKIHPIFALNVCKLIKFLHLYGN